MDFERLLQDAAPLTGAAGGTARGRRVAHAAPPGQALASTVPDDALSLRVPGDLRPAHEASWQQDVPWTAPAQWAPPAEGWAASADGVRTPPVGDWVASPLDDRTPPVGDWVASPLDDRTPPVGDWVAAPLEAWNPPTVDAWVPAPPAASGAPAAAALRPDERVSTHAWMGPHGLVIPLFKGAAER